MIMQLDHLREVILERQKSRLLKNWWSLLPSTVCKLSSQPNCLGCRWVEFSADWCKWHISNHESNSWSQKFIRCPNNRPRSRTALLATDHVWVITQGMLHHDKRVIQKPPRTNHLVVSALGSMLNYVSLWVTSTHTSILYNVLSWP